MWWWNPEGVFPPWLVPTRLALARKVRCEDALLCVHRMLGRGCLELSQLLSPPREPNTNVGGASRESWAQSYLKLANIWGQGAKADYEL